MAARPRTRVTGKNRAAYDLAHAAWRAGAIKDFRYGRRSPSDPTVVWSVDGREYGDKDHAQVTEHVLRELDAEGIASVALGESWMGYRSMTTTYLTGMATTERFDGSRIVRSVSTVARAA